MKKTIDYLLLLTIAILLSCSFLACSSTSDDSANASPNSTTEVRSGKFLDSAVEGLRYQTPTQEGITDEMGTFTYLEGEGVTFYIGDTELGNSIAKATLTPVDIVDGATDTTDPTVMNICRFLQTMDEDGNPDNGIRLNIAIHDEMEGLSLDFSSEATNFENDPSLRNLIDTLNALHIFIDGDHMLISISSAQGHMNVTLENIELGLYGTEDENDDCECDDADIVYTEGGSVVCGC